MLDTGSLLTGFVQPTGAGRAWASFASLAALLALHKTKKVNVVFSRVGYDKKDDLNNNAEFYPTHKFD